MQNPTDRGGQPDALRQQVRQMWALGAYRRFAKELVGELGERLARACNIGRGQRVLDVAAGTGNTALRAAIAGAQVTALDLTPEHFRAGRAEAKRCGVEIEWVQGDAEALPFADGEFDVVTSSVGAIFAPDHQRVADELLRVCKPGGLIGMINFTPDGLAGEFFGLFGPYAPAPAPDALPPVLWGDEDHVRSLFGQGVGQLQLRREHYVERADSPQAYRQLFLETFGPAIAIRRALADEPSRAAAFERDLLDFATRADQGGGGPCVYPYEYLLVLAQRAQQNAKAPCTG